MNIRTAVSVTVLTILTAALSAQGRQVGDRMAEALKLTPDQRKKIQTLRGQQQKEQQKQRLDMKELRLKIRRELLKDNPDVSVIKSYIDKNARIQADLELARIKHILQLKKILSKEQFVSFQRMMKRRMMMRRGGKGYSQKNNRRSGRSHHRRGR